MAMANQTHHQGAVGTTYMAPATTMTTTTQLYGQPGMPQQPGGVDQ